MVAISNSHILSIARFTDRIFRKFCGCPVYLCLVLTAIKSNLQAFAKVTSPSISWLSIGRRSAPAFFLNSLDEAGTSSFFLNEFNVNDTALISS